MPTWLDFGTPNLHFGTQKPPKSCLGGVLGVILAFLAALEGLLERLRLVLGRLEGILDRLGGILGRLGGVLGPLGDLRVCTGVDTQRPPIRILYDFPAIISNITGNIRKEMRKEIRIRI